jgi:ribosomal protein S8
MTDYEITAQDIEHYARVVQKGLDKAKWKVTAQLADDGFVTDFALDNLLAAQSEHRIWWKLEYLSTGDGAISPAEALKAVLKDLHRTLRTTSTTTGAVTRAVWEAERHAAAQFLDQWDRI